MRHQVWTHKSLKVHAVAPYISIDYTVAPKKLRLGYLIDLTSI